MIARAFVSLVTAAVASSAACTGPDALQAPASPRATTLAVGDTVAVWMTTANKTALLAKQPTLTFAAGTNGNPTITVNGATTYQAIDGFGYTLTGGSAFVINRMPSA